MKTIDLRQIISSKFPAFSQKPRWIQGIAIALFERILHLRDINKFIVKNEETYGINFIDEVFEMLNFSFSIDHKDIKKIPAEGRLICVSNHPIGSLDGMALVRAMVEVRPDVKIIANDILMSIENLHEYFLPFALDTPSAQKKNIENIGAALEREEAVIIFPAGEVSRLRGLTVVDRKWNKGPIYFSKKFSAPILPMFVKAKNSPFFYLFSLIHYTLSQVLLAHEMFNKKNKTIKIRIGDPIPAKAFSSNMINDKVQIKLLRKHTYMIGRGKVGIYATEKNIIHPVDKKILKHELQFSKLLGEIPDGKKIYLTNMNDSPNILEEIARLREITFRKVGEGTGNKRDIDKYDRYYKHIVVWDDKELEIVGSYRIGVGSEIMENLGPEGFYTSSLFQFSKTLKNEMLADSVELGRSFVQKKYWNTNALHILWLGIGAYLASENRVKYLFGPVSLSNNYPEAAKKMIVYYYSKWFGAEKNLVKGKDEYSVSETDKVKYDALFVGEDSRKDYFILKNMLKPLGFTVPILYKHYSDLCNDSGVQFHSFNVDVDFENCIDGFIVVDISRIKEEKFNRYINVFREKSEISF